MDKHPEAISYRNGCGTEANKDYLTFLEYDEYAKSYADITINGNIICFNQGKLAEMFPNNKSTLDKYIVGYTSGNKPSPIFYEPDKAGCLETSPEVQSRRQNSPPGGLWHPA